MGWQPDPLLLELFESVHRDLARALETRQRFSATCGVDQLVQIARQTEKIAKLKVAIAALEGALDLGGNGIVH